MRKILLSVTFLWAIVVAIYAMQANATAKINIIGDGVSCSSSSSSSSSGGGM